MFRKKLKKMTISCRLNLLDGAIQEGKCLKLSMYLLKKKICKACEIDDKDVEKYIKRYNKRSYKLDCIIMTNYQIIRYKVNIHPDYLELANISYAENY